MCATVIEQKICVQLNFLSSLSLSRQLYNEQCSEHWPLADLERAGHVCCGRECFAAITCVLVSQLRALELTKDSHKG